MNRIPRFTLRFAAFAALAAACSLGAAPGASAALRLPVVDLARESPIGAAYVADRIEVRLSPAAAARRDAAPASAWPLRRIRAERLGPAAVDQTAASLGAWFETEFVGETAPVAGSLAIDFTAFYVVHLPSGTDLELALERFRSTAGVASADPIAVVPVTAVPNDSLWSISSWFDQPSGHDIHAPAAWEVSKGDTSIVVAVLDTGVLRSHPDLGGTVAGIAGQIWTNWSEAGGVPGVDDDGNGLVDDTWGWDFVDGPAGGAVLPGEDGVVADNDPNDFAGHGTAVAGLIGALTDNGIGVAGTAWNVRLMPVRVGWASSRNPLGLVDMSYVAQGIRYATRMGANVINCSFETMDLGGITGAADSAVAAGIVIVCASGNSPQTHELADRPDVIAVAASDPFDHVAPFSNLGPFVDLVAPGVNISSTFVAPVAGGTIDQRQGAYVTLSGTSFAAPLVSGAAALVQSQRHAQGRKPLSPMGVLLRLSETTDDIRTLNPGIIDYGSGRLNLERALTAAPGSIAFAAGASTHGPAVVLPGTSGHAQLAFVTDDGRLIIVDSASGDTLVTAALPGLPARQLAAADLGGGRGVGLFVGTVNGWMAGYDRHGAPLPGWPKSAGVLGYDLSGGPALGDLDGDGTIEVVCGSGEGRIYAWHADGTLVKPGFPRLVDGSGISQPIALAPLDALPGLDIVATTAVGSVYAIGGDGLDLPGWPISFATLTLAPVVGTLGAGASPSILIANGNSLDAFAPDASPRWTATLPGAVLRPPALGDLDGDGYDEVIVATLAPGKLAVVDTAGQPWTTRGFPVDLPVVSASDPLVGPLRTGGRAAILMDLNSGLFAVTDSAAVIADFPKPGGAGQAASLGEFLSDGHTRIAAGTGVAGMIYVYDAGAGTWANLPAGWPTSRGNFARTGSRLGAPLLTPSDDIPPATVTDLTAGWAARDSVVLTWTAPGDDGAIGQAAAYELRVSTSRTSAADFSAGFRTDLPLPGTAGTAQRFALRVAGTNTPIYLVIRARDAAGNRGAASNISALLTPLGGPYAISALAVSVAGDSSVMLRWASPGAGVASYDVRGARSPLDAVAYEYAPLRRAHIPAAGEADSLRIGSLDPGTRWWFALRAVDAAGASGPLSNVASVTLPVGGALRGREGVALAVRERPSRVPVRFVWQGASSGQQPAIEVFDLSGRRLRTLRLDASRQGGELEWNGRDDASRALPAGLYFARLNCGSVHAQTRIVLLP